MRVLIGIAAAFIASTAQAEEIMLTCGASDVAAGSGPIVFEVAVDTNKPTVLLNGVEMTVRALNDQMIVFATPKPSLSDILIRGQTKPIVLSISRNTGVLSGERLSGHCQRKSTPEKLF